MRNLDDFVNDVVPPQDDTAVAAWIETQMGQGERPFLLAHTDDGVVWGRWDGKALRTSHEIAVGTDSEGISPPLEGIMLQQAFVFGEHSEIRLFHNELGNWAAKEIREGTDADMIVESQLLSGNNVIREWPQQEFTHLRDKVQQGLDQIVPLLVSQTQIDDETRPLRARLRLHHFITYDADSGEARIGLSRLVNVYLDSEEASA